MNINEKKVNPWAVCHASTGPKKSAKFERCVRTVKKDQGIEEMQTLNLMSDKIVEGLQFRLEEQQLIEDIMLFCEENEIDIESLNEEELNEFIGQMLTNLAAGKGFRTDAGVLRRDRRIMGQDPNLRRQMAKHRLTARGFNTASIPGGVSNDEFKRQQQNVSTYGKLAPRRDVPPPLPTAKAPTPAAPAAPGSMVNPDQAAEKKAAIQARLKQSMHQKLGGQGGYGGGAKAVMGGRGTFMPTAQIRQRSTADGKPVGGSISRLAGMGGKATARMQRKYASRFAMPQRASTELFGQKIVESMLRRIKEEQAVLRAQNIRKANPGRITAKAALQLARENPKGERRGVSVEAEKNRNFIYGSRESGKEGAKAAAQEKEYNKIIRQEKGTNR
jgi:hypothetical protein